MNDELAQCPHNSVAPYTKMVTEHDNMPLKPPSALEIYQGSPGRHGCVICAYNTGFRDAVSKMLMYLKREIKP